MHVAIDPGTSTFRVAVSGRGVVLQEPAMLVLDARDRRVVASGASALEMQCRIPAGFEAVRPLRDGRLEDPDTGHEMIKRLLSRALGWRWSLRPEVTVSAPGHTTEFDKRALAETFVRAGARRATLVERSLAAARGAGLAVAEPEGTMIVDLGYSTTEVGIVSLGGLAISRTLPFGGHHLDEALIRGLRDQHGLEIGPGRAEALKMALGESPGEGARMLRIYGRDAGSGRPRAVILPAGEFRPLLQGALDALVDGVRATAAEAPPVLAEDLVTTGVVLTGAPALLPGLERYLGSRLGLPVRVADRPDLCAVLGAVS